MPKKRKKDRKKVLTWRRKADIISFAAEKAAVFHGEYGGVMHGKAERNISDFFTGVLLSDEPGKEK